MREIKFRAWLDYGNGEGEMLPNIQNHINGKWAFGHIVNGSAENVSAPMQYTGLKDKNGVEIYEGDIVEIVRHDGDLRCKSKVCFMSGRWKYEGADEVAFTSDAYSFKPCIVEVVGNIHQNQELLD